MKIIEGNIAAPEARVAIVVARFNSFINDSLVNGALDVLKRQGQVQESNLTLVRVPGAVEIPLAAKKLAKSGQYDAIVALGTVIRGGTYHFELVASENGKGLAQVMMEYDIPVAFGVLTTDDEQYGGSGIHNGEFEADAGAYHSRDWSAKLTIPALGAVFLEPEN